MLKKQVIIQKGLNILTENPIILLYHFNNVSTKNWHSIKNEIKQIEDIKTLVLQNKIANKILKKIEYNISSCETKPKSDQILVSTEKREVTFNSEKKSLQTHQLKHLFQGPTFVIGCKTRDQLVLIYNLLKNSTNFVFVGGLYNNQNISHQNIEKIVKLNDSVKVDLIQFLEHKKLSIFLLNNQLISRCSNLVQILKIPLETENK